jgi:hypothetical protein
MLGVIGLAARAGRRVGIRAGEHNPAIAAASPRRPGGSHCQACVPGSYPPRGHFQVDWAQVWAVVEKDLAPLRVAGKAILPSEAP